jgi:hypothetical protein
VDANFLKAKMLDEVQAAAIPDSSEAIASGVSPAPESLAPANTMADPAPTNQGSAFDDQLWPDEWRDDAPNNVDSFFAHVRSEEAYWDSLGWPCHRAAPDRSNRLLPRRYPNSEDQYVGLDINGEYVTLTREVSANQPKNSTNHPQSTRFYRMEGNSRLAVDTIIVPREELTALEVQGWKV